MKILFNIVVLLSVAFSSCTTAFYKMLTVPDTSSFDRIQIDTTYELYVKRVCKKIVNKVSEPCNCLDLPTFNMKDVVEFQYMLISKEHEKIIVINYIKDRNQKFYTQSAESFLAANKGTGAVDINIWYFNQLRFGKYNPINNEGRFQTCVKPKDIHTWNLDKEKDTMKIRSVALELADGFDERNSEKSMALTPAFVKANSYNIFYQDPFDDTNTTYSLPGNEIFIDTKLGCIYFIFDRDISEGRQTIKFKKNRRYSYFPSNPTTND